MRHKLIIIFQWLLAAAIVGFAGFGVAHQWTQLRGRLTILDIRWGQIAIASMLVLGTYAVLIELWRRVLSAWGGELRWGDAAQIWFASSLGKYIPGNVWSIAALGVMAQKKGISGVAAAGSSILVGTLNLVSGLAIVLFCGSRLVQHLSVFAGATVLIVAAAIAAPLALPRLTRWLRRITGKNIRFSEIPPSTVWLCLAGTAVAWIAYGVAFGFFAKGIVGEGRELSFLPYIAVYTGAYILGFVTPVAPAGLGVREAGIVEGLARFGLMGRADALIVAITSRLWLTVLEVAPGLLALAASQFRTRTRHA